MKKDFFFCYDRKLMSFLKYEKNIQFITKAIHPKTKMMFWLFVRNDELESLLDEYQKINN